MRLQPVWQVAEKHLVCYRNGQGLYQAAADGIPGDAAEVVGLDNFFFAWRGEMWAAPLGLGGLWIAFEYNFVLVQEVYECVADLGTEKHLERDVGMFVSVIVGRGSTISSLL
jgi:hypothetical protein